MTDTPSPGAQLVEALRLLNDACSRIGIAHPALIGMRSAMAVNSMEDAIVAAGKRDEVRQITGGIEVRGVSIKQRMP